MGRKWWLVRTARGVRILVRGYTHSPLVAVSLRTRRYDERRRVGLGLGRVLRGPRALSAPPPPPPPRQVLRARATPAPRPGCGSRARSRRAFTVLFTLSNREPCLGRGDERAAGSQRRESHRHPHRTTVGSVVASEEWRASDTATLEHERSRPARRARDPESRNSTPRPPAERPQRANADDPLARVCRGALGLEGSRDGD